MVDPLSMFERCLERQQGDAPSVREALPRQEEDTSWLTAQACIAPSDQGLAGAHTAMTEPSPGPEYGDVG